MLRKQILDKVVALIQGVSITKYIYMLYKES